MFQRPPFLGVLVDQVRQVDLGSADAFRRISGGLCWCGAMVKGPW